MSKKSKKMEVNINIMPELNNDFKLSAFVIVQESLYLYWLTDL